MPGVMPGAARVAPSATEAAWGTGRHESDDGVAMHRGTLQAINPGAGTFKVYGQKLNFNPQGVKIFQSNGRPGSVYALKTGSNIRFTLDATDKERRRVAVIYAD